MRPPICVASEFIQVFTPCISLAILKSLWTTEIYVKPGQKSYRTIDLYKATAYTAFTMRRMAKAGNGKSPGKKNGAKARHIWQKRCVPIKPSEREMYAERWEPPKNFSVASVSDSHRYLWENCRGQFLRKSLAVGNTLRQTLNPPRPLLSCSNDTQKVPCRFTFFFAFPCVVLIREDTSNHQIRYFKYATKIEPILQGTSI